MKSIATFASVLLTLSSFAATPDFSAFSKDGELYVTVLGDTCNNYTGSLNVDSTCREDRAFENLATHCEASLMIKKTKMACKPGYMPKVMKINLNDNNVAKESRNMSLSYGNDTIEVALDRAKEKKPSFDTVYCSAKKGGFQLYFKNGKTLVMRNLTDAELALVPHGRVFRTDENLDISSKGKDFIRIDARIPDHNFDWEVTATVDTRSNQISVHLIENDTHEMEYNYDLTCDRKLVIK